MSATNAILVRCWEILACHPECYGVSTLTRVSEVCHHCSRVYLSLLPAKSWHRSEQTLLEPWCVE